MAKSPHGTRIHAFPTAMYQALSTKDALKGWFNARVDGDVGEGRDVRLDFTGKRSFRRRLVQVKVAR